jgi:putative inorganic carbon (HCO3(-)) transporter
MVLYRVVQKLLMGRIARLIASAELPILAAIAPAVLFPTPSRLLVLVVVPIVWGCAWIATGRAIPRTPLNIALWLLLAMVGISLYATFDVRFSLGKVSGVVFSVLVFWAAVRWVTTPRRLDLATAAFVLAGAGLAIVGLLGTNWINKFPLFAAIVGRLPKAIRGLPGAEEGFQPNAVAGCLVLFVPLQVALLGAGADRRLLAAAMPRHSRASWLTIVQILLLVLTAGTLLLTQSRGAWFSMIVAIVAFLAWHSKTTRVLAALCGAGAIALASTLGPARLLDLAISQSGSGMAGDVSGRIELWSRAIDAIEDFPFTGMGMNAFRKVLPVMYPTFLIAPDVDVAHAHNHLLQAALDLGIPGVIAYAAIWLIAGAVLAAVHRRSGDRIYRAIAGGMAAGLIAHFTFSMTDAIPLGAKVGVLFWLTLALAVALHRAALVA